MNLSAQNLSNGCSLFSPVLQTVSSIASRELEQPSIAPLGKTHPLRFMLGTTGNRVGMVRTVRRNVSAYIDCRSGDEQRVGISKMRTLDEDGLSCVGIDCRLWISDRTRNSRLGLRRVSIRSQAAAGIALALALGLDVSDEYLSRRGIHTPKERQNPPQL